MLTKEFLFEEHIVKRVPIYKIAKDNRHAKITVIKALKKYNISRDLLGDILTKEVLEDYYIKQKLSSYEIAKIFKCNACTVREYLRKYNIPIRSKSEAKKGIKTGPRSEEVRLRMKASKPRGEKHHNWKGGITPLRVAIHDLSEYRDWIKNVFRRDDYTCQDCGIRSGNGKAVILEAHHIKEFKNLLQEFLSQHSQLDPVKDKQKLLELAVSYLPFWDITNGKTLCWDCHGKTYKKGETNG